MTDSSDAPSPQLPTPDTGGSSRWSLSLIWLVPVVAALAGLVLVVRTYLQAGPTITISFLTAEGLEAEKTEVRYKNVVVGRVKRIVLSDDHAHVVATVDLSSDAKTLAVDDTRFWVERPRIGVGGVSGIGTLLSGAYIGVDIGHSSSQQRHFTGLEKPPAVTRDQQGRRFVLHSPDAGSLAIGSPVYYRRMPVGSIAAIDLDPDGKGVTVQVFIDAPNDRLVTTKTRFWNASGVDLSVNAEGLKLNTQALATVIAGGIAFDVLSQDDPGPVADEHSDFELYNDQAAAMAPPDGKAVEARMRFRQSTRGLSTRAPVDFQGITLGTVKSISLDYDSIRKDFYTDVVADLYPNRLGLAYQTLQQVEHVEASQPADMFKRLVDRGLRAQMRPGNIITGQYYIALDFVPKAAPADIDPRASILQIPTLPGGLEQLQHQIQDIVTKIDAIPFGEIGNNLRDTLRSADSLLRQLDHDLAPEARKTLEEAHQAIQSLNDNLASPDAPLQRDMRTTLEQVNRAAYSLRALADYLEQHPESLIRGKTTPAEPADDSGRKATP
jgi:paraquat-inducible protein B